MAHRHQTFKIDSKALLSPQWRNQDVCENGVPLIWRGTVDIATEQSGGGVRLQKVSREVSQNVGREGPWIQASKTE